MTLRTAAPVESERRLQKAERLLDQALADLAGKSSSPPVLRCPVVLAEALTELQRFARLLSESQPDKASFVPRMNAICRRLNAAQRLLENAAEFYRGWCAAGPAPNYPAPGYQADCPSQGPALLLFEG